VRGFAGDGVFRGGLVLALKAGDCCAVHRG
jgi:hypothetical protein